jgi:hypothetical protein
LLAHRLTPKFPILLEEFTVEKNIHEYSIYQQDKSMLISTDVQPTLTQNICPSHLHLHRCVAKLLPTILPLVAKMERSLQEGSSSTLYRIRSIDIMFLYKVVA